MTATSQERPPYLLAFGTFLAVFAIYLATLAPTTAFWDTSEYIAAAKVLGIPHPPGNPLFVILAHTFGLLPIAESYAVRINLFAAFTSAAAAGLWFLVAERWLRGIVSHRLARYAAAFGGVLVGATSWSVWNQSTVNEKVYTVSLLSIALVMWLVVRWGDDDPGSHRDRWLVLIAYVLALTSTNHLMGLLAIPALVVYVLWTDWRVVTRPTVLIGVVIAVLVGISLNYLWLPMRAGQYPPINEGEPVGFFSQALKDVLNRVQYGKPALSERQASFGGQLANFWQYYSWQFARDWGQSLRRGHGDLHRARPERPLGAVEVGSAGGPGGHRPARHAVAGARLLHELQVRLLPVPRPGIAAARGPRAGLLLHRLVRRVRSLRGLRAGRADAVHRRRPAGPRHRGHPLGRGHAGTGVGLRAARGQPRHGQPRAREDGQGLRLRHARERRALRHPDHRRRQRHLPAVVRPGGGGHPARRDARQPLADEHRVAPPPARPAEDAPRSTRHPRRRSGARSRRRRRPTPPRSS